MALLVPSLRNAEMERYGMSSLSLANVQKILSGTEHFALQFNLVKEGKFMI